MKYSKKNRFTQKAKPKDFKKSMLRLWSYFKNEKKVIYLLLLLIIIDCILVIVAPYLIGKGIDLISLKKDKLFIVILSCLIFSYLIDGVIIFIENFIIFGMSQRVVKEMRKTVFIKLQNLPIEFFDRNSNGDIMSRISNDIENISSGISDSITSLISGIFILVSTIVVMFILSPILTLCTMVTVPLVMFLTKIITNKTKVLFREQQIRLGALNGHIEEMISGINIIKTFNYEEKSVGTFKSLNKNMLKVSIKGQIYSSLLMPMMNVINNTAFGLISVVGAILAINNLITVGAIATFLSYSKSFTRPLNDLANLFNNLQSAVAGCERVFEVLDSEEEKENKSNYKLFKKINNDLVFENVSFGYKANKYIIKDVNLKIKANTSNAIIGETGCGKTTMVNLISRFYDINEGTIKIDGIDIRNYCRDSYRNSFGVVLQDSYLFRESIKENLRYGNSNTTDEEIVNACKRVGAHNFITKLEDGYDTIVNESGQNLSQGQKQLLTIARCILKESNILILDEATSSVDTKTELKVQETMMELMKEKTTFIIAHRLSTIKNCDNIIVIEDGKIKEMGNHKELMKLKGYYYTNVNLLNQNN
ncbi:ABC transporter ATP-binding protein [Romboutsia sp.]|uniref:ABC transporter ATP-binding protein n=1 Tax=Romboutsia sp. TaxID=1965302 RepID=UPI003F40B733